MLDKYTFEKQLKINQGKKLSPGALTTSSNNQLIYRNAYKYLMLHFLGANLSG